jgi:hypothetical protein
MPAYYKVTKDGQDTDDIPGLETQRDSVDSTQKSQRPSILNAFSASMSESTRRRKIAQRKLYIVRLRVLLPRTWTLRYSARTSRI